MVFEFQKCFGKYQFFTFLYFLPRFVISKKVIFKNADRKMLVEICLKLCLRRFPDDDVRSDDTLTTNQAKVIQGKDENCSSFSYTFMLIIVTVFITVKVV